MGGLNRLGGVSGKGDNESSGQHDRPDRQEVQIRVDEPGSKGFDIHRRSYPFTAKLSDLTRRTGNKLAYSRERLCSVPR